MCSYYEHCPGHACEHITLAENDNTPDLMVAEPSSTVSTVNLPGTNKHVKIWAVVVGAVLGAVVLFAIIGGLLWCCCRRAAAVVTGDCPLVHIMYHQDVPKVPQWPYI